MAAAPAIVRFVGGSVPDALATSHRMYEITLAEHPAYQVPILDFRGTPTGIDLTRVVRTGILPQINTGMAGRVAGTGQVGAGLVNPPAEIFRRPGRARRGRASPALTKRRTVGPMCRSIKTLRPPYVDEVSPEEIEAAALQYVRKVVGMRRPSTQNSAAFDAAVQAVSLATRTLLQDVTVRPGPSRKA